MVRDPLWAMLSGAPGAIGSKPAKPRWCPERRPRGTHARDNTHLCDDLPSVSQPHVGLDQSLLLLRGPVFESYAWPHVVEPSLSALLAGPPACMHISNADDMPRTQSLLFLEDLFCPEKGGASGPGQRMRVLTEGF